MRIVSMILSNSFLRRGLSALMLSLMMSGQALACGSCAMDAGLLQFAFLPNWFYLCCGFVVAATVVRICTRTLSFARVLQALLFGFLGFMAAAIMLGPLVLFFFLLAWFVYYIAHLRDKKGQDPASPLMAKLGHVFLAGLIISGVAGVLHDNAEAKLARGIGGTNTIGYCRSLAKQNTIPLERLMELTKSEQPRLRRNAGLVVAYSHQKSTIPFLIEALEQADKSRDSQFKRVFVNSLQKQTGLPLSEASQWREWLENPDAVEARVAAEQAKEERASSERKARR